MEEIEERAVDYAQSMYDQYEDTLLAVVRQLAYEAGASEQKAIDDKELESYVGMTVKEVKQVMIDKACEWLEVYMESLGYIDEWCRNGEGAFRKVMEE